MEAMISNLLESYELGKVSRRQLIQGLATLATTARAMPAFASTFQGVALNHIAINVTNVQRSRDFYQKLLGLPVVRESESNCFLGLGKNFLTLFGKQNPGMDHYCIAIEKFNADAVMEELKRQ